MPPEDSAWWIYHWENEKVKLGSKDIVNELIKTCIRHTLA